MDLARKARNNGRSLVRIPTNIEEGELYNNIQWLKSVNYCCKVLHFVMLSGILATLLRKTNFEFLLY